MPLDNKPYRDKVDMEIFSKCSPEVGIDGLIPSTNFRRHRNGLDEFITSANSVKAQLKSAVCLVLNGVDQKIRLDYQPTNIKINRVDVTANFTITDIGAGNWTIEPSVSTQVYNLLINDTYHYPCSKGYGVIAFDVSGNDNHGTVVNAVLPGIWGTQDVYHYNFYEGYNDLKGLKLNGTNQYFSLDSDNIYGATSGVGDFLALQIVIKANYTPSINDHIFSTYNTSNGDANIMTWLSPSGNLSFHVDSVAEGASSSDTLTSIASVNDGELKRITFLLDIRGGQAQRHRIYVNGVLDINNDNTAGLNGYNQNNIPITIGKLGDYVANSNFHYVGEILEVGLFNAQNPISLAEVEEFAQKGSCSTNPSHQWKFNNESGTYIDSFGGNNATLQNATSGMLRSTILPASLFSPDQDVLGSPLEYKGYQETHEWNRASSIYFPNVTDIHSSLRGQTFTYDELITEAGTNDYLELGKDGSILLLSTSMTPLERLRFAV